jgi:hypothetical protein
MNIGTPEDKIKNDDLQPFAHTNDCTPEIKIRNKYDLQSFTHTNGVNSINCFTTVNHRLAGPGVMVKLHLLFIGREVC